MSSREIALMAHLMRRAGFGATRRELESYAANGYEDTVERLLDFSGFPGYDRLPHQAVSSRAIRDEWAGPLAVVLAIPNDHYGRSFAREDRSFLAHRFRYRRRQSRQRQCGHGPDQNVPALRCRGPEDDMNLPSFSR